MSFFGKLKAGLKSAADRVTGGYGELDVWGVQEPVAPGHPVRARVALLAREDLKISRLVVTLQAVERGQFSGEREEGWHASFSPNHTTFKKEVELCGELTLSAGQVRDFPIEIDLPADALPSFDGKHLDHEYQLSAVADIPWGVDLKDTETVQVIGPAQQVSQDAVKDGDHSCSAALSWVNDTAAPGGKVNYKIVVVPASEPVGVQSVKMHLRCIETLDAELTKRAETTATGGGTTSGTSPSVQVETRRAPVEVITSTASYQLLGAKQLTSAELLLNVVEVPDKFTPGYSGKNGSCRAVAEVVVHLDSGRFLVLRQDFRITPEAKAPAPGNHWNATTGTYLQVCSPKNPISVKCPQLGWIQLRGTVHWAVAARDATLKGSKEPPAELRQSVAQALFGATTQGLSDALGVAPEWSALLFDPKSAEEQLTRAAQAVLPAGFEVRGVTLEALALPETMLEALRTVEGHATYARWFDAPVKITG